MANVVIKFKGELCKKLELNERALTKLAVDFESVEIIDAGDSAEVKRMKGMDGASHLLTLVCAKIDESGSDCLKTVFQVLEKQQFLSDIVKKMKEGLYVIDLAIINSRDILLFSQHIVLLRR